MLKKVTLILGVLGLLIYVFAIVVAITLPPVDIDPNWIRCVSDWSPIDGPRFTVEGVAWTSDGRSFRFTVRRNAYWPCGRSETYIANVDGSGMRVLGVDEVFEWYMPEEPNPFRWADGSIVKQAECNIHEADSRYSSDESAPVSTTVPVDVQVEPGMNPMLLDYAEGVSDVSWAPDACHVLFIHQLQDLTKLKWMDITSGEIYVLAESTTGFTTPQWSSDAAYFAYATYGEGELFLVDVSVGEPQLLMDGISGVTRLVWLNDNRRFLSVVSGDKGGTYLAHADRLDIQVLVEDLTAFDFSRSPIDNKLVVWGSGFWFVEEFAIAVLDLDEEGGYEVSTGKLIEKLEERAVEECLPADCKPTDQYSPDPFSTGSHLLDQLMPWFIPIGLALMVPGLWVRRERLLAKIGLGIIGLHVLLIVGLLIYSLS
jgi:hypothetical protein